MARETHIVTSSDCYTSDKVFHQWILVQKQTHSNQNNFTTTRASVQCKMNVASWCLMQW
jgi:hypothetical protein